MKSKLVIIAAIVLGILAAAINWAYVSSVRGSGTTVLRVKEGKRIAVGQKVNADLFEPVTLYGDVAQLRKLAVASSEIASFKDNPVTAPLEPGDLLLLTAFQLRGDPGLRREIGPGERAITVAVSDESKAVGFFVRPGDVVDMWGIINDRSYLLKDHAKVAAVGDAVVFDAAVRRLPQANAVATQAERGLGVAGDLPLELVCCHIPIRADRLLK